MVNPLILRPYQGRIIEAAQLSLLKESKKGSRHIGIYAPQGGGKCLGKGTEVLMFDGSKKLVEDIVCGDELMGDDSTPRLVINTTSGYDSLYEVKSSKGWSYVCNSEHLISYKWRGNQKHRCENPQKKEVRAKDWCNLKRYEKSHSVMYKSGVEFSYKKTVIDPYILGLWIADGTKTNGSPEFSVNKDDREIIDFIRASGGFIAHEYSDRNCLQMNLTGDKFLDHDRGGNIYRNEFRRCFAGKDHHDIKIPDDYKINSREMRLRLLAGILDGDGNLRKNCFEIITKFPSLSRDLEYITRSLGLCFSVSSKAVRIDILSKARKTQDNAERFNSYFRIMITGNTDEIPTRLKRKQATKRMQVKNPLHSCFTVNEVGYGEYFGFQVVGTNNRFLLGDFTVTHNSVLAAFMAQNSALKGNLTLILTHRAEILKQNFAKMELLGLDVALLNADTQKIPTTKIVCAMTQTLNARCENAKRKEEYQKFIASFDFIIIDEAHRSDHDKLFQYFKPDAWVVGMTATWLRSGNQKQLGDFYSDIVAPVMPSELIELGNILPSENFIFDAPKLNDIKVDYSSGDYNQRQLQNRFAKPERYAGIIENYQNICPGKKVIVFTTGGDHCVELTKQFCEAGIKAKYLLSERKPDTDWKYSGKREDVIDEIRRGDIDILLSVEMLSTGLDIPELEGVILDFSTKSYTKYQQCVARPDRPYGSQKSFFVLDFGENVKTYGKFEDDPIISLWHRPGGNGVAPSKFCPTDREDYAGHLGCGRIVPVSVMVCPYCGFTWLTDKQQYEVELTKLVETKKDEEETIHQYCARKRLEGWGTQRILVAIMTKNKDNMKKSFMEAIRVLRTDKGEMVSPSYYYFLKKYIIDKKVKR